jgi:hypothetical protein
MRSIVIEPTRHPSLSGPGAFSEREDRAREPPTATWKVRSGTTSWLCVGNPSLSTRLFENKKIM